jgi:1-acyl-sn-glycerol-3-phosphate acyltransferase
LGLPHSRWRLHSAALDFIDVCVPARSSDHLPLTFSVLSARYLYRVPMLVWHLCVHLPVTLALINNVTGPIRIGGERLDSIMVRFWQGNLMRIFGFRLRAFGTPHAGSCLSVANHVSWLDITLIHSQRVVHFVAKSEISRWPLVGWMARKAGTIYHQRGSTDSLNNVSDMMVARMQAGHSVGVFPEGGSSTSFFVRTFHARIFQPALDANAVIQPIALRYLRDGELASGVPFQAGEGFLVNFLRLLGEPGGEAHVHFLPVIESSGQQRRTLAQLAHGAITACVGFSASDAESSRVESVGNE